MALVATENKDLSPRLDQVADFAIVPSVSIGPAGIALYCSLELLAATLRRGGNLPTVDSVGRLMLLDVSWEFNVTE